MEEEPLLKDDNNRFTVFPIVHNEIYEAYSVHKELIWFVEDIDLTTDFNDWDNLGDDEKHFITHILAFFASSDGIVNENLTFRFYNEVKWAEVRCFYAIQIFIENEHSIMYSRLIDTYIKDRAEKERLFNAITTIPAIKRKAEWALKWIESEEQFAMRLIAFAIVEGLFFSGAFCSIYWLNEKKKMPALSQSNSYIARDEGLHCLFAVMLYKNHIVNKIPRERIEEIMKEAVEIEKHFINEALPCALIGMNADHMSRYIECCADRLIIQLGYTAIYNAENPFPFMDSICLTSLTNFFDTRSTDYKKNISSRPDTINITEDF